MHYILVIGMVQIISYICVSQLVFNALVLTCWLYFIAYFVTLYLFTFRVRIKINNNNYDGSKSGKVCICLFYATLLNCCNSNNHLSNCWFYLIFLSACQRAVVCVYHDRTSSKDSYRSVKCNSFLLNDCVMCSASGRRSFFY